MNWFNENTTERQRKILRHKCDIYIEEGYETANYNESTVNEIYIALEQEPDTFVLLKEPVTYNIQSAVPIRVNGSNAFIVNYKALLPNVTDNRLRCITKEDSVIIDSKAFDKYYADCKTVVIDSDIKVIGHFGSILESLAIVSLLPSFSCDIKCCLVPQDIVDLYVESIVNISWEQLDIL